MEKELLEEIYSDIKKLNNTIQHEIASDLLNNSTPINNESLENVEDFLSSMDNRSLEQKIINLDQKRTLKQQLTCLKLQKEQVKKVLE